MWNDFKEFIARGNVLDLAVAVILGVAFGAIVTSLVDDIIMPLIGIVLGRVDFSGLSFQVRDATVAYGNFIQALINFLIVALVLFLAGTQWWLSRAGRGIIDEPSESARVETVSLSEQARGGR